MSSELQLNRRSVLALGVIGTVALAGCSPSRPRATPATTSNTTGAPTSSPPTSSRPTTTVAPAPPDWLGLRSSLSGRLVLPSDAGYQQDLQLYDSRYDTVRPAAIAYCAGPTDVQRCVAFARLYETPLTARSGGHSYAGYSTGPGLVIDVTAMNSVSVSGTTATVAAGARLIDTYTALNNQGVSIPAGSCPTVGIAGLTLGGGAGVVGRLHGLTCDRLTSVEMVTADGRLVAADAQTNTDLFWACQGGGGGNFGVVTSFGFETFPTSEVAVFTLEWPWAAAADVLPAWLGWAPGQPDALWSNCVLQTNPGTATPQIQVSGVWVGSTAGVAPQLARLVTATDAVPSVRSLEPAAFEHAMYLEGGCAGLSQAACHLPGQTPGGTLLRSPSLAKSDYLNQVLGSAGVQAVLAGLDERHAAGGRGAVGYDAYGGAINRVAPGATAFVHRNAVCSAQYGVPFSVGDPAPSLAAGQAWLDAWYTSLRPYASGFAYQNYIDPGLSDWANAYYGTNLPRLQQVKAAWDPDDTFHFAQSIPLPVS